jgi:hypothetical protein
MPSLPSKQLQAPPPSAAVAVAAPPVAEAVQPAAAAVQLAAVAALQSAAAAVAAMPAAAAAVAAMPAAAAANLTGPRPNAFPPRQGPKHIVDRQFILANFLQPWHARRQKRAPPS